MASTYKVLGQSADPLVASPVDLYTVGAGIQAVLSTLTVCNRTAAAITYRIAVRPSGATLANTHYIVFDASIAAKDTVTLTLGISLSATDVLTVGGSVVGLSISAFGVEIV
jgi:hypothetical protein